MASGPAPWVYRDGRRRRNGPTLLSELVQLVRDIGTSPSSNARESAATNALVACGELEAALADAGHRSAPSVALETDCLAAALLGQALDSEHHAQVLEQLDVPAELLTSTQEGCAFYALHPSSYARAAHDLGPCERALVVGIRTIGATLSAVVASALRGRGVHAARCTVRPGGHPYARTLELDPSRARAVERARAEHALAVVVDEGPGLSGSTFLAVAERLARAGIPDARIVLMASARFDASKLAAADAASRFRRFRTIVAPVEDDIPVYGTSLSGGVWRARSFQHESSWPAVFAQMERRKALIDGGTRLMKFEGLGPTGRAALERGQTLFQAGFVGPWREEGRGYVSYRWEGAPCRAGELDLALLEHLASYCAKRPELCPPRAPPEDLGPMLEKNLAVLGHADVSVPRLLMVRAATVDGRMPPHEWLRRADGTILKCDAIAHGDDHLFPGPTDIAWDLAGAMVEWRLAEDACEHLLNRYAALSGDDARARIDAWTVAYATFRAALTALAFDQSSCSAERGRLARDLHLYRSTITTARLRRGFHR